MLQYTDLENYVKWKILTYHVHKFNERYYAMFELRGSEHKGNRDEEKRW